MKLTELTPVFVETMPEVFELGKLYISRKYQCSIHLCACGECNQKTVLPFNHLNWWTMVERDGLVTFRPSVGNWQFPCKSHYYITDNKIKWL